MRDGFEYGNTRLRARKAGLLDRAAYDRLVETDLDGLLGALAETPYRADVEAALPRARGLNRLHEAVRTNLARTLGDLRDFYAGKARAGVDLLLGRWDPRNLRAVLRGLARRAPAEDIRSLLVPGGALDAVLLRELAGQPGVREAVDLLVSWPTPLDAWGRELLAAWPAYERTGELAVLDGVVGRAWARHLDTSLAGAAEPLPTVLRSEIDVTNVLNACRLQAGPAEAPAPEAPAPEAGSFLPAGRLAVDLLERAARARGRREAAELLAAGDVPAGGRPALARWAAGGPTTALARELEAGLTRQAVGLFLVGDPLSIAVPIAFVWAKENEARNLRVIGGGIAAGVAPDLLRAQLVLAG